MDPRLARYPFLPEAGERVAEELTLEELVHDRAYRSARRRGRDRVMEAVTDGQVTHGPPGSPGEALTDLLSYALARILVSATEDDYVVRRHALGESERVTRFLRQEGPSSLLEAAQALGVELEPEGEDTYRMHFTDYLRQAAHIRERGWKLINQPVDRGVIRVTHHRASRLVEEALRRRIEEELPRPVDEDVRDALAAMVAEVEEAAKERRSRFTGEGLGEADLSSLPPCMTHLLGELQSGVNVSHSGRFAVAAFLSNIGMSADEIIDVFSQTADFREDLARYQVEHITGESTGTEYTTPSCATMKTHGNCYDPDWMCEHVRDDGTPSVTNPLNWYRWRLSQKEYVRRKEAGELDEDEEVEDDEPLDLDDLDPEDLPESIRAQSGYRM